MKIQEHVGQQVAKYRKAKGLSHEQLSFEAGFHRTYISQAERGVINPKINSLKRNSSDTIPICPLPPHITRWAM